MIKILVSSNILGLKSALQTTLTSSFPHLKNQISFEFLNKAEDLQDKDATILLGDPRSCADLISQEPLKGRIKWIQSTFAGVEPFFEDKSIKREYILTRCCSVMGKPMAQYVASWVLAFERKLFLAREHQLAHQWKPTAVAYRPMSSITIGILGFGDIGKEIAKLLHSMDCDIIGFKRNIQHIPVDIEAMLQNKSPLGTSVQLTDSIDDVLEKSDYIVNVLPNTPSTTDILTNDAFESCRKSPCFINIGRSNVINEAALLKALSNKWLSKAVLDVFCEEPLPKENKLWDHPNVFITPHISGISFPEDVARVFLNNLDLFVKRKHLDYVVNFERGY